MIFNINRKKNKKSSSTAGKKSTAGKSASKKDSSKSKKSKSSSKKSTGGAAASKNTGTSRYGGTSGGYTSRYDDLSRYGGASGYGTQSRYSSQGSSRSRGTLYDDFDDTYVRSGTSKQNTDSRQNTSKKSAKKSKPKRAKKSNDALKMAAGGVLRAVFNPTSSFKLNLFLGVCIFALIFLMGRIAYWKIAYGTEFEAKAISQQINKVNNKIISPNRGDILDRNNEQLAVGETVFNIILDVKIFDEQDRIDKEDSQTYAAKINSAETAEAKQAAQEKYDRIIADSARVKTKTALSEICGITEDQFEEYVAKNDDGTLKNDTNYLIIAKKIEYDKGKQINNLEYSWLYAEQDTKRSYPYNGLAAQVIGFIRGDTLTGLESQYNDEMTGTPGRIYRTYESDNSVMTQQEAPKKGNTLITTLDVNMQQFAEEACKEAYDSYDPEYTSTVIMNPQTGEVYAMAQYPTFDSNDPMQLSDLANAVKKTAFEAATEEEQLNTANKAWKNFAVTDTFEPGSIYKPIVVAMALEEGVISMNDTFSCGGVMHVGDYDIHCNNRNGHGTLTVEQVLAQSCNVGMMQIIAKLGKDKYYKYQQEFGYGETTGIDLPAESNGLVYDYDQINATELATCSFGQGFNCTVIQALTAFNAVINGGNILQPYVVSQIVDEEGNVVKENSPHVVRKVISQETSDSVRKALEAVINENATGRRAVITGYALGGKTGTAEQGVRYDEYGGEYTLNFIAYHSVEDPEICVMTVIHKPPNYSDSSGISPGPMLKSVFEKIIDYQSIPPDYDSAQTAVTETNTITVSDYTNKSLKDTISDLIDKNMEFTIIGNGDTVIKQSPVAGSKLTPGAEGNKILLNVSDSGKSTLVAVPDVTGLSESAAKQTLEAAGLKCYSEIGASTSDTDGTDSSDASTPLITSSGSSSASDDEDDADGDSEAEEESTLSVVVQMPASDISVEKDTTVKIILQ